MDEDTDPLPALTDKVSPRTTITYDDLALIGAGLLSTVSIVERLGWASPGSSLDYIHTQNDPHTMIVRDFIVWTSHRKSLAEGCEERLRNLVRESGWTNHIVSVMGEGLFAGTKSKSDRAKEDDAPRTSS
jgi:hypothetical protein